MGIVALVSKLTSGFAPWAWITSCALICLALAITKYMDHLPMEHEAIFRAASIKRWYELPRIQRLLLQLFDYPLFHEIRTTEFGRLREGLFARILFDDDGFSIQPVEATHRTPYFLSRIATYLAKHGLKAKRTSWLRFSNDSNDSRSVRFAGGDEVILGHLRKSHADRQLISLGDLWLSIESGYSMTLPEEERYKYMMAVMR